MKYKLLAVDIDGTLINNRREITPKTKEKVHLAISKGVVFTICSGRPVQGVRMITDQLGVDIPVISYNGAMVVTGIGKKVIYSCSMRKEDVLEIERLGNERNTTIAVWSENKLYVNRLDARAKKYSMISGTEPIPYDDIEKLSERGISKVLWYDEVEKIREYEKQLKGVLSSTVNFHTSQPIFLEFVDQKVSKAIALEKMGEYYGIQQEKIIAVGDGFNDLSMIEYAGLGVAMGNAPEGVKQAADYITQTNEKDGVAYVIDQFILK